jgi:hypothetical protein
MRNGRQSSKRKQTAKTPALNLTRRFDIRGFAVEPEAD